MEEPLPTHWDDPPWNAALHVPAYLAAVPATAEMSGMFLAALADAARARGQTLPSARTRYVPFRPYPLREHCQLLIEAAHAMFPSDPLRQALRQLGHGAPRALIRSTVGRVVFGSVEGPVDVVRAMAKSYPLHTRPGSLEVVELAPGELVVRLRDIYHFLDSHHVGVFEGVLSFAGVAGRVTFRAYGPARADMRLSYRTSG